MEVKYIEFSHRPRPSKSGKTQIWLLMTDAHVSDYGDLLGEVRFHGPWRRYVFYPERDTLYEQDCLRKIADFCEDQTKKLRKKWAKRRKERVCQGERTDG